jgi:hypothetical protein
MTLGVQGTSSEVFIGRKYPPSCPGGHFTVHVKGGTGAVWGSITMELVSAKETKREVPAKAKMVLPFFLYLSLDPAP